MPGFFQKRTNLQLTGDIAIAGLGGAKTGVIAGLGLSAAVGGTLVVGSIGAIAGACALGAAIGIIPAMMLHKMLFNPIDTPSNSAFLLRIATNNLFRSAFAFSSACIGAAILGMAIMPIATAAFCTTFALGLFSVLVNAVSQFTTPANQSKAEAYLPLQIA